MLTRLGVKNNPNETIKEKLTTLLESVEPVEEEKSKGDKLLEPDVTPPAAPGEEPRPQLRDFGDIKEVAPAAAGGKKRTKRRQTRKGKKGKRRRTKRR